MERKSTPAISEKNDNPELSRLLEDSSESKFWKLWGPYLSGRQWGTVREDYSADGDVWGSFNHDAARSRAYRWGEDGLLGFTDHWCRLCFGFALWNGKDPFLKERLFGLTGPQGNHGEDVKELYYYLDSTPTHSYCRALYKYPIDAFPYEELIRENASRSRSDPEFEISDTEAFQTGRYFELEVEYAKAGPEDVAIRVRLRNNSSEAAQLHLLANLWFRNTWSWGATQESPAGKPLIREAGSGRLITKHPSLPAMEFFCEQSPSHLLFTENETNSPLLFGEKGTPSGYYKDAFHRFVVEGDERAVNPEKTGTKSAAHYELDLEGGAEISLHFRLRRSEEAAPRFGRKFHSLFDLRKLEADRFYSEIFAPDLDEQRRTVARHALAGLFWSKQFYSLVETEWRRGDPLQPPPPQGHAASRNTGWDHLFSQDILLMPDNWEYPYFCAWDLAFHAVSVSQADPFLAKEQLDLLLREWYMHPNGQLPAYEWNFSDVNPPVHAWAAWRIHRLPLLKDSGDRDFLRRVFHKLLFNFTWWVARKDPDDRNLFSGGFLGLDNIEVFDRSKPLPTGGVLKQADGTAWMAFFCVQMLMIALELAQDDPVYEDLASKFFDHFVRITHAINEAGGCGLWDEQDGFYYDLLEVDGRHDPLRVRSVVGLIPLLSATIIPESYLDRLPEFRKKLTWFLKHRPLLSHHLLEINEDNSFEEKIRLLAIPTRSRLEAVFKRLFDENEFLSPFGIRSLSKSYEKNPYVYQTGGQSYSVDYEPGEGLTGMFGGNSNWRGPIWMPINYLILESLRTYHKFYGDSLLVEFPTGSGEHINLGEAAKRIAARITSLFVPGPDGTRPCLDSLGPLAKDPGFRDLPQFHEYFHAETGRGCGASHQTGWTSLIADLIQLEKSRDLPEKQ